MSVDQDGRQLLAIHARLLEAESSISNFCPRCARITWPFEGLLFQQVCLYNMNWVSSVGKLTHRLGGRGLIPVIVWSWVFLLTSTLALASTRPPVRWGPRALSASRTSTRTRSWTFFPHLVRFISKPWMRKEIGGMTPAILNFGNGWELVIGSTAQPVCYGEGYPGVYWIARWVRPRASLGVFFFEKERKLLLFPGIEPRFFEYAASGLVTVLTELSRLLSPSVTKVIVSSDVVAYGREIFCLKWYPCRNIYQFWTAPRNWIHSSRVSDGLLY